MPIGMAIAMGLTIAGILALFIVWHELDRVERIVEEAERRRLGLSRPIREGSVKLGDVKPRPAMPKPAYRPPSQKGKGKGA
jgi:hypothetical protein